MSNSINRGWPAATNNLWQFMLPCQLFLRFTQSLIKIAAFLQHSFFSKPNTSAKVGRAFLFDLDAQPPKCSDGCTMYNVRSPSYDHVRESPLGRRWTAHSPLTVLHETRSMQK